MRFRSLTAFMLTVFIASLLPMLMTGAYIQNSTMRIHKQNVTQITYQSMERTAQVLENEIINIQSALLSYMREGSSALRAFVRQPENAHAYQYYITLMNLQESFALTVSDNRFIDEICLHFPRKGMLLSSRMGASGFSQERFDNITESLHSHTNSLLIPHEDALLIIQTMPLSARYAQDTPLDYMLVASLSRDVLRDMLLSSVYANAPTFILSGEQEVFSANCDEAITPHPANGEVIKWNHNSYIAFIVECSQINCSLVKYLPYDEVYGVYRHLFQLSILYVVLAILVSAFYCLYVRGMIHKPVRMLETGFEQVSNGNMSVRLPPTHVISDFEQLYLGFNQMTHKLVRMNEQILRQELLNSKMELKQLQSQINPHFLYNAFFILKHHIQNGSMDSAEAMAEYMGDFFQYITRSGQEESTLAAEYTHAESFLNIQKMRFMDRINIELAPPSREDGAIAVPRLILQPLVENIFAHSRRSDEGILRIVMSFSHSRRMVECVIEDNGDTLSRESIQQMNRRLSGTELIGEITGMLNTHRRLQLRFGPSAGLFLSHSSLGGLKVVMRIPQNTHNANREEY